jgi:2Fe-2S ferredoxin
MTQNTVRITVLPHAELCPQGAGFETAPGATLCDALHANGIAIEHACEKACVCTSCHVIVHEGFNSLRAASDDEEDQLGKAWGLELHSRLSCQARVGTLDLVIEIPRYSLNLASEGHTGTAA